MFNLDSLAVGDQMYVYGSSGEDGFVRDLALEIATNKKLNIETNIGLNPDYPAGTTGDWSDHAPFKRLGIPYGYLEATSILLTEVLKSLDLEKQKPKPKKVKDKTKPYDKVRGEK